MYELFIQLWLQCRISGYNYTAVGNSTNKKDAQSNAAKDMIQYLVRIGQMNASEVPNFTMVSVLVQCFLYIHAQVFWQSDQSPFFKCACVD
jgi:hypothetical protein